MTLPQFIDEHPPKVEVPLAHSEEEEHLASFSRISPEEAYIHLVAADGLKGVEVSAFDIHRAEDAFLATELERQHEGESYGLAFVHKDPVKTYRQGWGEWESNRPGLRLAVVVKEGPLAVAALETYSTRAEEFLAGSEPLPEPESLSEATQEKIKRLQHSLGIVSLIEN